MSIIPSGGPSWPTRTLAPLHYFHQGSAEALTMFSSAFLPTAYPSKEEESARGGKERAQIAESEKGEQWANALPGDASECAAATSLLVPG